MKKWLALWLALLLGMGCALAQDKPVDLAQLMEKARAGDADAQ